MKWKDVYNKCNNTEASQLIDFREPAKIEANIKKFYESYKIAIILFLILFVVLAFTTYKFNAKTFLACVIVLLIAMLFVVYYNSYSLLIKNNKLKIKIQFNDIELNCDDLVTLFISRKKVFIFIVIPMYVYYVNIIYCKGENFNIITLPTVMCKKEDIYKFFKHFTFQKLEPKKRAKNN